MIKLLQQSALLATTTLLSVGVVNVQMSQAGSLYKLSFYEENDVLVGEGSFEVSDTPYEITIPNTPPLPPYVEITVADQLFEVTNFSVTIHEQLWNTNNSISNTLAYLWTGNSLTQPQSVLEENRRSSSPPSLSGGWYFAKGRSLAMPGSQFRIDPPSSFSGYGDRMYWFHAGYRLGDSTETKASSGYVLATAIPEPMTIAGLAVAAAGLAATRRRLATSKR